MATVTGAVKVQDLPDLVCFKSFEELLQALEKYLVVEVPDTITNVIVSNVEPQNPSRNLVWVKQNNAGTVLGFSVFSEGEWQQVFPPPSGIHRMHGNSNNPDPGYSLITNDTPGFTSVQVTFLRTQWLRDPTDSFWTIYDAIYTGL